MDDGNADDAVIDLGVDTSGSAGIAALVPRQKQPEVIDFQQQEDPADDQMDSGSDV